MELNVSGRTCPALVSCSVASFAQAWSSALADSFRARPADSVSLRGGDTAGMSTGSQQIECPGPSAARTLTQGSWVTPVLPGKSSRCVSLVPSDRETLQLQGDRQTSATRPALQTG